MLVFFAAFKEDGLAFLVWICKWSNILENLEMINQPKHLKWKNPLDNIRYFYQDSATQTLLDDSACSISRSSGGQQNLFSKRSRGRPLKNDGIPSASPKERTSNERAQTDTSINSPPPPSKRAWVEIDLDVEMESSDHVENNSGQSLGKTDFTIADGIEDGNIQLPFESIGPQDIDEKDRRLSSMHDNAHIRHHSRADRKVENQATHLNKVASVLREPEHLSNVEVNRQLATVAIRIPREIPQEVTSLVDKLLNGQNSNSGDLDDSKFAKHVMNMSPDALLRNNDDDVLVLPSSCFAKKKITDINKEGRKARMEGSMASTPRKRLKAELPPRVPTADIDHAFTNQSC